jgi:hypothetical protein
MVRNGIVDAHFEVGILQGLRACVKKLFHCRAHVVDDPSMRCSAQPRLNAVARRASDLIE